MRKSIFTLLFSMIMLFLSAQQIDREMVLLEIGTGTWCVYCPGAAMGAHDLLENGHPVAVIKNHNGDAYANVYSNARNSYYGISGYPTTFFDGQNPTVGGSPNQSLYTQFLAKVNQRLNFPTSFKIDIFGEQYWNDYTITLRVEKVADYQMNNIVVHLVLTESNIPVVWFNQTQVDNVNRLMVPNQNGTPLTIETGETAFIDLEFTFNNSWVKPNTELVAFIQNNTTKEVMHSTKVPLLELQQMMSVDFSADITEDCPGSAIQFNSDCSGSILIYEWEFPGGEPATTNEQNPTVVYSNVGTYDVTLTIHSENESMSLTKENYITIEGPEVSFDEVPVLCTFWDPYELTEGKPSGGTYSGEGVVDGYFHPQMVGAGSYEVTYTYFDEDTECTVEVAQVLSVDECTNIEENSNPVAMQIYPNPTKGIFSIDLLHHSSETIAIKIFNSLGQLVFEQTKMVSKKDVKQEIDLSSHAEGIYLLQLNDGTTTYTQRIILKK